jgi:hypothetical protein
MTSKEAERLVEILAVLHGGARGRRGKGLYLARSIATQELRALIVNYGASNVEETARTNGWILEDKSKTPEEWVWQREPTMQEMRRRVESMNDTLRRTTANKKVNQIVDDEQVYIVHARALDASRGQVCACTVCENYRKTQPAGSGSEDEPKEKSRWSLLEID